MLCDTSSIKQAVEYEEEIEQDDDVRGRSLAPVADRGETLARAWVTLHCLGRTKILSHPPQRPIAMLTPLEPPDVAARVFAESFNGVKTGPVAPTEERFKL